MSAQEAHLDSNVRHRSREHVALGSLEVTRARTIVAKPREANTTSLPVTGRETALESWRGKRSNVTSRDIVLAGGVVDVAHAVDMLARALITGKCLA